jgi:uncharacterized protein
MSQETMELARRGYEAFVAGDLEAVLELIDPDVEVEIYTGRPDLPETQTLHGHSGFLENIRQLSEAFEDIRITPEEYIEAGEELIVQIHTSARGQGSGIEIENRIAHVWSFRDGKVIRFRVYPSKAQALEAI